MSFVPKNPYKNIGAAVHMESGDSGGPDKRISGLPGCHIKVLGSVRDAGLRI